ncbi:MAG: pilus assembly protein PilP [Thermoanaerobaculia bacterium]
MSRTVMLSIAVLILAIVPDARAQQSEPAQTDTTATAQESAGQQPGGSNIEQNLQEALEENPIETYRYDPQGRRDPFRSLIGPSPKITRENAPEGPAGFMIDEIDLQGIIRTGQGLVAMIDGPDNKGYLLRNGDKVFDGEVIRITADSVVFRQEVNDPTRIERYREVVKELTPQSSEQKGPR